MIPFTIYNKETGLIRASGVCTEEDYNNIALNENESILKIKADIDINYIENSEVKTAPKKPLPGYVFDIKTKQWIDGRAESEIWVDVISKRNLLLSQSDWRVIRAQEIGIEEDQAWKAYRQALRDITQQQDPRNIQWPMPPETE